MARKRCLKNIRLHSEGNDILRNGLIGIIVLNGLLYFLLKDVCLLPFYVVAAISITIYAIAVNFFRCPIRLFQEDTEGTVVAAADGKIVVIEEVEENEYFHDRRLMISIFMSVTNVHANWFPVEGTVKRWCTTMVTSTKHGCLRLALKTNARPWLSKLLKDTKCS